MRHFRVRKKISGTDVRPRLAVFRSLRHIYAQLIDDLNGVTIVSASSQENDIVIDQPSSKTKLANQVGELIADRAKSKGVKEVGFDRGGFIFLGRVKSLAEAARKGGLGCWLTLNKMNQTPALIISFQILRNSLSRKEW